MGDECMQIRYIPHLWAEFMKHTQYWQTANKVNTHLWADFKEWHAEKDVELCLWAVSKGHAYKWHTARRHWLFTYRVVL